MGTPPAESLTRNRSEMDGPSSKGIPAVSLQAWTHLPSMPHKPFLEGIPREGGVNGVVVRL